MDNNNDDCMAIKHIQAPVTEEDHSELKEAKGDEGWGEFILELKGPKYERKADSQGRISLPSEYAGKQLEVRVVAVDDNGGDG